MSENKFIAQLKGNTAPGSVLEIQDKGSKTSFANMPSGTSDAIVTYSDKRNNATAVLKGAMNWKVNGSTLSVANPAGDGSDYTGQTDVAGISDQQGNNLWINASYTVPADGLFLTKNTKWVLKLCGDNLIVNGGDTAEFTVLITAGNSTNITKKFFVGEQANQFCKELVIDFAESNTSTVKLEQGDTITLKLLSDIPNASARIYQGMTTLTLLQRAVDAENVISKAGSYEDIWEEINKKVNIDGSSIMSGPLKFRAGSFVGAIAGGLGDGISFYKLKSDNTIDSEVASLTKTNGFTPGTTNTMNIGSNSLKWKDAYIGRVITSVLNNGTDINVPTTGGTLALNDFSNITDSAKNISNWSSNVSNCITEIPQDIKLTLASGTLTLKAGSKVYFPNGANTFDSVTITTDKTYSTTSSDGKKVVFCNMAGNGLVISGLNNQCSGTTDSLIGAGFHFWYDTTNNKIKQYGADGVTQTLQGSFPIAIITYSNGAITSIDQVFNGFGYIGSTVFALPGVKGLAPNGFNTDGTLKTQPITIKNVITKTIPSNTGWHYIVINDTGTNFDYATEFYIGTSLPSNAKTYSRFYNTDTNETYVVVSGNLSKAVMFVPNIRIEHSMSSPYKINSMEIPNVFHAVDYTDYQKTVNQVNTNIANIALKQDEATALNYDNISNCITEIPQDIIQKTSALFSAGSKIYFPDGTYVVLSQDIGFSGTPVYTSKCFGVVPKNLPSIYNYIAVDHCFSGSTAPTGLTSGVNYYWLDISASPYVIKRTYDAGATWVETNYSLPLCTLSMSSGFPSSIDQVFNGFGYFGSTVFALPGVKYLRANGRNSDGTLKSILSTISSIRIATASGTYSDLPIILGDNAMALLFRTYDEKANKIGSGEALAIAGKINVSSGAITELSVKTSFHAVDYNDGNFIANCAMPSTKYTNLTLPASDGRLTAPADGYYTLNKQAGTSGEFIFMINETNNMNMGAMSSAALNARLFVPVSKGDVIKVTYTFSGTTNFFRFVYANGAK